MTESIWKFPLEVTDEQSVSMPEGAEIIALQIQREVPCVWAIVDPQKKPEKRFFRTFGTGQPLFEVMSHYKYIGSYQISNGNFVGHVFETNYVNLIVGGEK
jgi:hypothetical protein